MEKPDISKFESAIQRLQEGLEGYRLDTSNTQMRDGLIQRFEFTYELAHRFLKRYLEFSSASPGQFNDMTFATIIRTANEQDLLLGNWPDWRKYRELRTRTTHNYEEQEAERVVNEIPRFIDEVLYLRDRLRSLLL